MLGAASKYDKGLRYYLRRLICLYIRLWFSLRFGYFLLFVFWGRFSFLFFYDKSWFKWQMQKPNLFITRFMRIWQRQDNDEPQMPSTWAVTSFLYRRLNICTSVLRCGQGVPIYICQIKRRTSQTITSYISKINNYFPQILDGFVRRHKSYYLDILTWCNS